MVDRTGKVLYDALGAVPLSEIATPTAESGIAKLWTTTANILCVQFGDGTIATIGGTPTFKSYSIGDIGTDGTHYLGGFYDAAAAHEVLTIGGTVTRTYGTAGRMKSGHAFCVAEGAGGADLVLTVTGVSITDAGVRNDSDSEIIVADADTASVNDYFETTKNWVGQITYTLTGSSGAFTFNYGFVHYDSFGGRDFKITEVAFQAHAGGNETTFDLQLLHHKVLGWTYHASAFVPGTGALISSLTDLSSTNNNFGSGEDFHYHRDVNTEISGSTVEGIIVKLLTAVNNSIDFGTVQVGVVIR